MVEPTKEDLKNGWTKDDLNKYHMEREKSQFTMIYEKPPKKPRTQNNNYSPLRWRR